MDADRIAEVRSKLMSELDFPVTAGEVTAAAEAVDEPDVAAAATRLPDDGTWIEIDALWDDLDPLVEELIHRTGT
jgi:hypothetical protein